MGYPKSVSLLDKSSGTFVLSKETTLSLGPGVHSDAPYVATALADLRGRIAEATNSLGSKKEAASDISLDIVPQAGADPEGYKLTVQNGKVLLEAHGPEGFSHGVSTLQQ